MALEGVKSEKSEENNGNVPDGKANGIDNKSKQRSSGSGRGKITVIVPFFNYGICTLAA
ncbi:hypothetical protein O3G_MSEX006659 [Manduca sexta]|uniref:Uncharacterized protein n=1 Tax=Manduca sexta TaxID=7130 RepID=A0A922CLM1_MANSE|nr:hypothetical protein O3G_MSEX006659 [Manduca sexta]